MANLYDKTGAAFILDHEHGGTAYVRPLVKVIVQSGGYDDEPYEAEDFEPAAYLVSMDRSALFDAPPVAVVNEELAAKQAELDAVKAAAQKAIREINSERSAAERELQAAKRQLDEWMKSHRVMMDLGKLLDGQTLYPLTVKDNVYHHGPEIPRIPSMRDASYLVIHSGDFDQGRAWKCKKYGRDTYGSSFQFFYTEEERSSAIEHQFNAACEAFRRNPDFSTTSYTTTTTLHYGTLTKWVVTHPALRIPDDIKAMKAAHDAELVERRKAKLVAELAEIEARA